jgi:uncharacterized protein YqiB (DUF1249 family)
MTTLLTILECSEKNISEMEIEKMKNKFTNFTLKNKNVNLYEDQIIDEDCTVSEKMSRMQLTSP